MIERLMTDKNPKQSSNKIRYIGVGLAWGRGVRRLLWRCV
jgi:hypothetical protein